MKSISPSTALFFAVLLVVACPSLCYAYADPGAGFLVWQSLLSGVVGALFYFRKNLRKLLRKLNFRSDSEE